MSRPKALNRMETQDVTTSRIRIATINPGRPHLRAVRNAHRITLPESVARRRPGETAITHETRIAGAVNACARRAAISTER